MINHEGIRVTSLLSTNSKLSKLPNGKNALIRGLSLAPHILAGILTVCAFATAACMAACVLWFAGRTVMASVRDAAIARTQLYFKHREFFLRQLAIELRKLAADARELGVTAYCRLNTASDVPWYEMIARFPEIVFYDYTKSMHRIRKYIAGELPSNYSLTYSRSEKTTTDELLYCLKNGVNVAVVFDVKYNSQRKEFGLLPGSVTIGGQSFDVVDGDLHDIRTPEFDGRGKIVGLRLKGMTATRKSAIAAGFAVTYAPGLDNWTTSPQLSGSMELIDSAEIVSA